MSPEIRKTIEIDAPVDVVYKAISDEEELTRWFPNQAILERRTGGRLEFKFNRDDGTVDHRVEGTILEIVPGRKLAYSWKNASDPDFPKTSVIWTLEPLDGNKTRVSLVHTGFEQGRWFDLHDGGWSYFIGRLAEYSTKGSVKDRAIYKELGKEIRKSLIIKAPSTSIFRALTDAKELTQWFSNQGANLEPRVGGTFEFRFLRPDGEKHAFRGKIVEFLPDRKLVYTWNNAHAHSSDGETVSWTLEPAEGGKTRVTVIHSGLRESKEDVAAGWSYEAGWTYFLERLVDHCNNR